MKKSKIPIILGAFLLTGGVFFTLSLALSHKKIEDPTDLINISELPEDFINDYFREISEHNSEEEKNNMLIAIASSEIENSYGAANIIKSPNNQYILQYNSEEEKTSALKKLKENNSILSVEENGVYTTEEAEYNSWGIEKLALDYAVDFANSHNENMQQITAAIIDTGCDMTLFNKYYGGKITEFYNVLKDSTTEMSDVDGHGTHVAGTIAEGTPSNVKIMPIKVSNDGSMYYTDIIAAINYIGRYKKADVINMSFGGYGYNEALEQTIDSAKKMNIISVAAAGNDNTSKKHYPSSFESTISIASVDSDLNKSTFSNYGAEITFAAPGTSIKSIMGKDTRISQNRGNKDGDDHETISGTSMATPHAVAAVAVLKGYNKDLTFENVVDILKDNAQDLGEEGWDQYYGYGLISFKDVEFCDGTYCDELGVYKDLNKVISNIDATNLSLTQYNYYSITNLMGSKVNVTYTDGTHEELSVGELPNVDILNYDPIATGSQTVTIKTGSLITEIQVTNPNNYESGWEYNTLANGKVEITGYKNHNLEIERLYVPEVIDSKQVASFADNFKFAETGNDIESYTYLYLPSTFTRIGNYSLAGTKVKYIYGSNNKIEVGTHAFENSKIVSMDIPISKIEDYAFKDCFELVSIKVSGIKTIGNYSFYNCKKLLSVEVIDSNDFVDNIGDYAFYNCVELAFFGLVPGNIGEYSFYGTYMLISVDLSYSESIGKYAFYGSGISEVEFSYRLDVIQESSFENCRNLKNVADLTGRIESRAFWNSGVETISLWNVEYIAEDAFAYAPIKDETQLTTTGIYQVVNNLGIVENGNKLLVGFTDALAYEPSNTNIPEYITEIGNYAFTGNSNLKKIIIPTNVTKIGTHAFEDCYELSNVYMLGDTINFEDNTFKRNYEGEIQGEELKIYVYKDSATKQFVKNKNLNYRHIEPDEIVVTGYEDTYKALSHVDIESLGVKLIYHEEDDREENLEIMNFSPIGPISTGVGFNISYQREGDYQFQYGDTYFTVNAKNALGYLSTKNVEVTIEKTTPTYTVPTGLSADFGQQLSEIELPSGFEWMDGSKVITESGDVVYKAKYIPEDTNNYEIVENIDIIVSVNNSKTIISPEIVVENKTYDETTNIPASNITISNLESSEYSIISATSSNADVGNRIATIKLRLTDDKYASYSFDNGKQEKEFAIDFNIVPKKVTKPTKPDGYYTYNGEERIFYIQNYNENYMDMSGNKGTDAGIYTVTITLKNDNYTWDDDTTDTILLQYEIKKANLLVNDNSNNKTVIFDGLSHTIDISLEYPSGTHIKYKDDNGEYILDQIPEYTEAGEYTIGYKLYINENYTEYFGERTLTILSDFIIDFDDDVIVKDNNIIVNTEDNFSSITDKIHTNPDNNSFEHRDEDGNIVNSEIIKTGDKIKIIVDVYEQEYILAVLGDTDGNGAIEEADYLNIKKDIMEIIKLSGAYKEAADMNSNNEVDIIDYIRIKKKIMGDNI